MANPLGVPIGWAGGTALGSLAAVRKEARYAAEAGFDSFWVSQIFGVDPIVALAAVADDVAPLTEVGTSVVPLFGRHPLALAAQARTAQAALDGRFTLGVGASHQVVVEALMGLSYERPYAFTRESVLALEPLLRGDAASVGGDQVTAHGGLTIEAEPVPLLLAAMGPRMLRLAGELTDGTSLGMSVGPRTLREHIAPTINAAAADAGRPAPRIKAFPVCAVTDDPDAARAAAHDASAGYSALPAYAAMLEREGVESAADVYLFGSMDEIAAGFQRLVDAGATELRIGIGAPDEATERRTADALAEWIASA